MWTPTTIRYMSYSMIKPFLSSRLSHATAKSPNPLLSFIVNSFDSVSGRVNIILQRTQTLVTFILNNITTTKLKTRRCDVVWTKSRRLHLILKYLEDHFIDLRRRLRHVDRVH